MAAAVKSVDVPTVNGKVRAVKADDMGVTVSNAKAVATDLAGSHGVIYVVDTVILP